MLFALSFLLLLAVVGGFFGLIYLNNQHQQEYDNLNAQLNQEKTPEQKALENSVLNYKQRLQDFSKILNAHTAPSRFFASLEQLVYPSVYFDSLILNPEDRSATILGKIDTFESLQKQIMIFENAPQLFDNVSLTKIDMGSDGLINFSINAKVKSDAILYK